VENAGPTEKTYVYDAATQGNEMKSIFFALALFLSLFLVAVTAWSSLFFTSVVWQRSVATRAAEILRSEKIMDCARYLNATVSPWWIGFMPSSTGSNRSWLEKTQAQANKIVSEQNTNESGLYGENLRRIQAKTTPLEQSAARLRSRYQLLAAGSSELFHLELASEDPVFYSGGLLAGLPVLRDLPDGINTLPELSASITKAGGVVTITEFSQALDGLIAEGKDLTIKFQETKTALSNAKGEKITLQRSHTLDNLRAEKLFGENLDQTAASWPSPFVVPTSQLIDVITSRY